MQAQYNRTVTATGILRAGLYDRVSTNLQKQHGYSVDAQFKDTQEYAASLGAEVVAHWSDVDSGAEWNLPGLNAMLDAAREKQIDVVICYDPDRFARNMTKQLVIEEQLRKHGVTLTFARFKLEDNAEGRLLKNQLSAFAEYEREKIRMRTMRGRREKAERGLVVGQGTVPYGYRFIRDAHDRTIGLEPDTVTAPILQRIFAMARYHSTIEIVHTLNAERIPGPRGKTWGQNVILRMTNNPVYIGTMVHGATSYYKRNALANDKNIILIPVPPLVTQADWELVHAGRERRLSARRRPRLTMPDPYTLRCIITCGHCGGMMSTRTSSGVRYYLCSRATPSIVKANGLTVTCHMPMINSEAIETHVQQAVCAALLDRDRLAEGLAQARAKHANSDSQRQERLAIVDGEIKSLRGQLAKIADKLLDTERGSELEEMYRRRAKEAEDAIQRYKAERAKLEAMKPEGLTEEDTLSLEAFAEEVRQGFDAFTPADNRRMFELLQLRVTLTPAPNGVQIRRHRLHIAWAAAFELVTSDHRMRKECG